MHASTRPSSLDLQQRPPDLRWSRPCCTARPGWAHFVPIINVATDNLSTAPWPRLLSRFPSPFPTLIPIAAFGIAYLLLLRTASRGRARLGLTAGLLLMVSPLLWPWYVASPVVLSAADDDGPALWLAYGLCAYGLLYLGDAGSIFRVLG